MCQVLEYGRYFNIYAMPLPLTNEDMKKVLYYYTL